MPGIDGVGRLPDGRRVYFLAADDAIGTLAERTFADSRLTVDLPDEVSASVVAAGMIPAISSWVALTLRAPLQPGQSVLVLGATGTAGQLAVQIAKYLGAGRVVAVGRNQQALQRVHDLGADVVRLTGTKQDGDAVAAAASDVDIVLDYLWGTVASAVMPALCHRREAESRALTWVLIGSMAGDEIALSLSVLLRKRNLHILGNGPGRREHGGHVLGRTADCQRVCRWNIER
ncbi:MAG: zinc-binding dehydrogenase [Gemmatimonadaceae bacterium]